MECWGGLFVVGGGIIVGGGGENFGCVGERHVTGLLFPGGTLP